MTLQELKKAVAKKIMLKKNAWTETYANPIKTFPPNDFERQTYKEYADIIDREIKEMIPESEWLTIELTGCAKGELSHYTIEDSLKEVFKPREGILYDSEGGQFWVYVKSSLVQKVLRHIDYHFPGQIDLNVGINKYGDNPWFQNWTQAEMFLSAKKEG
jgi:hypothetical protein